MTKAVLIIFSVLTLGTAYMSVYGVGAQDSGIERSVRDGSAGHARGGRIK